MNYSFSSMMQHFKSSAVRDILKLTQGNAIISFAGGLPAEELFPIDAIRDSFARVFDQGAGSLQYGLTEGYLPLREQLCNRMADKNIRATPEQMLITTGSQQGIDLMTRVYTDPGDVILVESPTYLAALQVFQSNGAKVVSVQGDQDGMDLNDLADKLLIHKPKMVYVTPTFSNPAGKVWSIERRRGLLELCKKHNALILEDDPYGELKYIDDDHFPSIYSMETDLEQGAVVYTSTMSKIVAPALRTGWVIGGREIIQNMAKAKQAADLHSSSMDQQALYQLLCHFDIDGHIAKIREHYGSRMKLMSDLMKTQQWSGVRWNEPKGGMFLWVELPEPINASDLLKRAVQEGVAFVPGESFFADSPELNTMRMNFTHADPEQMTIGIGRLAAAMNEFLAKV